MRFDYSTKGICAKSVSFEVEEDKVKNISYCGGCDGNHNGIARLVEGMEVDEVIKRLSGVTCGSKSSSCPDQLAAALRAYKNGELK